MKKIFLGLFSLTLLGLILGPLKNLFKEEAPVVRPTLPKEITEKTKSVQKKILEKVLPKLEKSKSSVELIEESLMDYHVNPKDFIATSKLTKEEAKDYIKNTYTNLKGCFDTGCGQEPDEETGFYDPANTVAVSTMIRIFEIADANFEDLSSSEWLGQDELLGYLDHPSSKLRKLALKNLFKRYPEKSFQKTMQKLGSLSGYQAGDAVKELVPYLDQNNSDSFVELTKEIIKEGEPFTITEILTNSEKATLSEAQIEDIGSQLCVFNRSKKTEIAFNSMNHSLGNLAKNSGTRFDLKAYCR